MFQLRALEQFVRPRAAVCEICAAPLGDPHGHAVELQREQARCVCQACALLFRDSPSRFRTVPDRVQRLTISDEEWASLQLPVQLSYLILREQRCRAFHPSPAGAIEAAVADEAWSTLLLHHPQLQSLAPQVEALLSYQKRGSAGVRFIVPVDACWELLRLVQRSWRGFSGGDVGPAIEGFLAGIEQRRRP
jgi:hypothetical protein